MVEKNFGDGVNPMEGLDVEVAEVEVAVEETAVVKAGENLPATTSTAHAPIGVVVGEMDQSDATMPRLNLVQSVGPLSEHHDPGTFVYNREVILARPNEDKTKLGETLELTVLSAVKKYQEVTPYDSDQQGRIVDTKAELEALGGYTDWRNDEAPPWRPFLTAIICVKAPEDETLRELFKLQGPDGESYELMLYTMAGTAWTSAAKAINTAAMYTLRGGKLHHGVWTLGARREKRGANFVFVPKLTHTSTRAEDDPMIPWLASLI